MSRKPTSPSNNPPREYYMTFKLGNAVDSLREQIDEILYRVENNAMNNPTSDTNEFCEARLDEIMSLLGSYIEAAEIDRAIVELQGILQAEGNTKNFVVIDRKEVDAHIVKLQAQKAVLENKQ